MFVTADFHAIADIMLVDVRGYDFEKYDELPPGFGNLTWLVLQCQGFNAALKAGGTLVVIAPTFLAIYWTLELDKILLNKAGEKHKGFVALKNAQNDSRHGRCHTFAVLVYQKISSTSASPSSNVSVASGTRQGMSGIKKPTVLSGVLFYKSFCNLLSHLSHICSLGSLPAKLTNTPDTVMPLVGSLSQVNHKVTS